MKILLLTGKPACGKDTQAALIAKKFKARKIITSKLIDDFFNKTKTKEIKINGLSFNLTKQKKLRKSGKLVAYRLTSFILSDVLLKAEKNKQNIVISGSPRSLLEARTYLKLLQQHCPQKTFYFIYLNISDQEAIKRSLLRKRKDLDVLKVIKERLKSFRREIIPAIKYLNKQGVLVEVNGERKPQKVFQEIIKKLKD